MELRHYLKLLYERLWLIVLTVVLCTGVAYIQTPRSEVYIARSTVYVGGQGLEAGAATATGDRQIELQRIAQTFSVMIDSTPIASAAIQRSNLPRSAQAIVNQTTTAPQPNTNLIRVAVRDRNPAVARAIANGLADAFVDEVQTFEPGRVPEEGTVPALPAYVFERAPLPTSPVPTGVLRNLLTGAVFGLLLSVGIILLLNYLDVTIRDADDAERVLGLPVLGSVPLASGDLAEWTRSMSIGASPPPSELSDHGS